VGARHDTDRNRLGAAANRAEEAKYRRIANDMDDAFPGSAGPPSRQHTATCDAWADMNGSGCTCHVGDDVPGSSVQEPEHEIRSEGEMK
jgi:hypothetical protein